MISHIFVSRLHQEMLLHTFVSRLHPMKYLVPGKSLLGTTVVYDVTKGVLVVHQQSVVEALLAEYGM